MTKKRAPRCPGITTPLGFRAAGGTCGLKPSGQPDLAMIVADKPCPAAGVFTTNNVQGAPVVISKQHLQGRSIQAIVCNSGQANVGTGRRGLADARRMCELTAKQVGCDASQVLVCSTGVIGQRLEMAKIARGIAAVGQKLARGSIANCGAANSILTTDLTAKSTCRSIRLGEKRVHLAGIAKGSGMIGPNMATMLVFLTTDFAITAGRLKRALVQAVNASFNRIGVDMDTSTSDAVLILANGAAGNRRVNSTSADERRFVAALTDLCKDLAYRIVRDGEGATKVFRVDIRGARSEKDADLIGRAVVGSPLVKAAVHGSDPNWGRLLMAVGKSGAAVDPDRLTLQIERQCVFKAGTPARLSAAAQRRLDQAMKRKDITFKIALGLGNGCSQWLGCDLSREYVAINADYTT